MSPLRTLAPPGHAGVLVTWELTADKDLRPIREEILRRLTTRAAVAERIGLVMTELAGNALRHGAPPIRVRLLADDDCYILDVSDHAINKTPEPTEPSTDIRTGGRGLRIALAMAQQVCWHVDGEAKHVWATFPLHD